VNELRGYVLIGLAVVTFLSSLSLEAKWARTYGGDNNEEAYCVQQTFDGGYIVAGQTESYGAGKADFWVLKLFPDGTVQWERTYGGKKEDIAFSIRQTSDEGYIVAGQTESYGAGSDDYLVLKLDHKGNIQWQKTYGGIYFDRAVSICESKQGGYLVGGHTSSFGAGVWDFWLLKLDTEGSVQWQYTYGGKETEYLRSVKETDDGGYILTGTTATFFKGYLYNIWVVKISSDGLIQWERSFGGAESEWGYSIAQTADGGYIVAGDKTISDEGPYDFWILKLSAKGKIQWQYTYGKEKQDIAYAIAQMEDRGYMVSGFTESSGLGSTDIWVMKLMEDGSIDWQRTYGGMQVDRARAMSLTNDGGCIVAGETRSYGAGWNDIWLMKLDAFGNIDPSCGFIRQTDVGPELGRNALEKNSTSTTTAPSVIPAIPAVFSQQTAGSTFLLCEAPQFQLTISTTTGGSTQPSPGIYRYYKGYEKQITAIPDSQYAFSHWSGNISPSKTNDNPLTLQMDKDRILTAHFDPLVLPPTEFTGSQVMNRSLSQAEYINVLSWRLNPANVNVKTHRIYVEQVVSQNILAELPVSVTVYWHRNVEKSLNYVYFITAVNADGIESAPLAVTFNKLQKGSQNEKNIILLFHSCIFGWICQCV
jgi:uncharacterized delta-60 repeat protein